MTDSQKVMDEIERCSLDALDKFFSIDFPLLDDEFKGCIGTGRYMYGHPLEIINTLQVDSEAEETKYDNYPLIGLYTDFPVRINQYGDYHGTTLQLIIAVQTEADYSTPERVVRSFTPFLRPLLARFLTALKDSSVFSMVSDTNDVKANIWERFYWGTTSIYGNEANTANTFIDAIQIENLELRINVNDC